MAFVDSFPLPPKEKLRIIGAVAMSIPMSLTLAYLAIFPESVARFVTVDRVILGLCAAAIAVVPCHEMIHLVLFRFFGATPVWTRWRPAINAPTARLSRNAYLAVLLAPVLLIVGTSLLLLYFPTTRIGDLICIWTMPALSASDVCRVRDVARGDPSWRWADLKDASEAWD